MNSEFLILSLEYFLKKPWNIFRFLSIYHGSSKTISLERKVLEKNKKKSAEFFVGILEAIAEGIS